MKTKLFVTIALATAVLAGTTGCSRLSRLFSHDADTPDIAGTLDADPAGASSQAGIFSAATPDDPTEFLKAMFADDGLGGAVSTVGDLRHRYFSEEMAGMLADTTRGTGSSLAGNPLCLCNNPTDLQQTIVITHADAHKALAHVTVTRSGVADGPTVHLVIAMGGKEEGWKITDIRYPDENVGLRDILAKANAPSLDVNAAY